MATSKRKRTKEYRVVWEIDLSATSPTAAAKEALRIQRDPASIATHFIVHARSGRIRKPVEVDLWSR